MKHRGMTKLRTPLDAATAVLQNPTLPVGEDERVVGFGVMGFPFASGHYLALRCFPATSFSPGYRSVWHRDPAGVWTFYATTPGQQSCARYFSSVTPNDAVRCDIDIAWVTPWSLFVEIAGLLEWYVDLQATPSARLVSAIGGRLPARAWTNRLILGVMGRAAGPLLRAGAVRLSGTVPNGHYFMLAPKQVWVAAGSAVWRGEDLGQPGPLHRQARLSDFRAPQRGIFVTGTSNYETFDAARHRASERTISIG
jgi:hypothetical protein